MSLTAPTRKTAAAAALIRAGLCDDVDTGVLITQQNGGAEAGPEGAELTELLYAVIGLAVRTLLASNGYNVDKAMAVIDLWLREYGRQQAA